MREVSDYSHAMNIETLKNWNIGDKVKFDSGDIETIGIVKRFDLSEACSLRLVVYDFYNKEELFIHPDNCHEVIK